MTSVAAPGAQTPLAGARRTLAIATILAAMTLAVLDAGMSNVALPSLARAFDVAPAKAILVMTAYQAGLVMALLPAGALGERHGHPLVFRLSVTVFATAAALAALSPGLPWLIAARFVQGLGGAGIMALGMALMRVSVPRDELGRAIGWNAMNVALASAAAPSLGALILAIADWRWMFAVNLPIAALALLGSLALPSTPRGQALSDVISMSLSAAMFALLIAAAQSVSGTGFALMLLAAALTLLALLVRREAPKATPLFPLDLLRSEPIRLSAIASVCCFAGTTTGLVTLPFWLQHHLHQTALTTGLCITIWPLSVAVAASLSGRLADRVPTAWLCGLGGGLLAAGLATCGFAGGIATLAPGLVLAGLGFGPFQSPNNRTLLLAAPAHRSGAAGGLQGTARVCGQTAGALLTSALFAQGQLDAALPVGFAAAAALALAAAVVSLFRIFT